MSKRVIDDTTLSAIGDAIRDKNGTETMYKPSEMASAISAIMTKEYVFNDTDYEVYQRHQITKDSNLVNIYPEKIDFMLVHWVDNAYVYIRGICPDDGVVNRFPCYCFAYQPSIDGSTKLGNYIINADVATNSANIQITNGAPITLYNYDGALQTPSKYSIFVLQRK